MSKLKGININFLLATENHFSKFPDVYLTQFLNHTNAKCQIKEWLLAFSYSHPLHPFI